MSILISVCIPDKVTVLNATPSYSTLNDKYLSRGLAVVLPYQLDDIDIFEFLTNELIPKTTLHPPCDVSSNLVLQSLHSPRVILAQLVKRASVADSYYLQFRNCKFEAVKVSRRISARPDFYSPHLRPAYSSWILISRNYETRVEHRLNVVGLVFVQQLSGNTTFMLSILSDCVGICHDLNVTLTAGQGLIFVSDLWDVSYWPSASLAEPSIAFITETEWND